MLQECTQLFVVVFVRLPRELLTTISFAVLSMVNIYYPKNARFKAVTLSFYFVIHCKLKIRTKLSPFVSCLLLPNLSRFVIPNQHSYLRKWLPHWNSFSQFIITNTFSHGMVECAYWIVMSWQEIKNNLTYGKC